MDYLFEGIKESKLSTKCSMIFRFGGRNHLWQSQNISQLIIYPTNNEFKTGYYVDLPVLNECISSASYIYNNTQNTERIYQFGGCDNDWERLKDIKYLDLNDGFDKWFAMKSKMEKAKCFPSLCNYKDGIFVIGGYDGEFNKDLEFIDIKKDDIIKCKDMIYHSSSARSVLIGDKLYVCGGLGKVDKMKKVIQIYDITKDNWYLFDKKAKYNNNIGYIWNNVVQPNIIYITEQFTTSRDKRCFIEWMDLRDNKREFMLLHEKENKELFNLEHLKDLQKVLSSPNHCNLS